MERGSRAVQAATALLAIVCIWQSARFFSSPHENWQAAADALAERMRQGGCMAVAPPEQAAIYEFFRPDLRRGDCRSNPAVLAVTPYATPAQTGAAIDALQSAGCRRERTNAVGGSLIIEFLCRAVAQ